MLKIICLCYLFQDSFIIIIWLENKILQFLCRVITSGFSYLYVKWYGVFSYVRLWADTHRFHARVGDRRRVWDGHGGCRRCWRRRTLLPGTPFRQQPSGRLVRHRPLEVSSIPNNPFDSFIVLFCDSWTLLVPFQTFIILSRMVKLHYFISNLFTIIHYSICLTKYESTVFKSNLFWIPFFYGRNDFKSKVYDFYWFLMFAVHALTV